MTSCITRRLASALISACVALGGCAATKNEFYNKKEQIGDWSICQTFAAANESGDHAYINDVYSEIAKRGMTIEGCRNRNMAATATAVVGIAAGVAAIVFSASRGGGNYIPTDVDWAWDQFTGQYGGLTWACRGRQTGQFAENWRCNGKAMNDFTWPGPNL